ncbi:uncharacterized protein DNG_01175 [Cephalotrichum gorgonifer]|uniref:NACHT domain-containing protein n=1 Tax=Cephalotrichum gorgonifer TaxID=2041049 RepID=A0AAE8SRL3_9PEZI|nr:uncharacterized protein DNG_01175 [Cephalotrichum gorgonifer]
MKQLVQAGLERTQKEAAIKREINAGLQAMQAVKGAMDKAVQAAPEAAVAWVGVCFGLEILSNPVTEPGINRQGIAYVISRMEWYWNLVDLLLDDNKNEKSSAGLRDELEKHVSQLYQKLLLYEIKSVCLYRRSHAAVVLRDVFKLDDWAGQLNEIQDAEAAVNRDSEQYNTEQVKSYLQGLADTAHSQGLKLQDIHLSIEDQTRQQEKRHQDDKDEQCLKDLRGTDPYGTDPRDDKTRIQDTKGGLLWDSYRWILDHDGFRRFHDNPQSRLLWIKGDPGKGKTMLMCGIIDELEKEPNNCLSYFFCQATEARLSNATAVLRGLIYFLVDRQPLLTSYVRKRYKVDQLARSKNYDQKTRDAVQRHLTGNADGTFLWVALVCQELAGPEIRKRHTLSTLESFPPGLGSLYKRMIEKVSSSKDANLCKEILATVSIAYRPLALEELKALSKSLEDFDDHDEMEEIIRSCGSFLTLRKGVVSFVHQSAKDFLLDKASDFILPSGIAHQHRRIFSRSLEVLKTLRRDIYSLHSPGFPADQVSPPKPDPLAPIRYSCISWVDHLSDSEPSTIIRDKDLQDDGAVHDFIREKYLYWLESLSLLHSMSEGVIAVQKLEALVVGSGYSE